jgi:hypothetical protein
MDPDRSVDLSVAKRILQRWLNFRLLDSTVE